MMTTIKEGDITFTFPEGMVALKYDDTKFFVSNLKPTGAELKAVDIVVCPGHNRLILIEIKDFRGHKKENLARQTSGELVSEVVKKTLHTISGLYLASNLGTTDLQPIIQAINGFPIEIGLVLFMEEDKIPKANKNKIGLLNQRTNKEDIRLFLRRKLQKPLGINSRVLDISTIETRDGWSAATK